MKTMSNPPLVLAFIIVVVVFLLSCGGAITMTMMQSEINKNGFFNSISWMWVPTIVTLLISILLGWALYNKRSNE